MDDLPARMDLDVRTFRFREDEASVHPRVVEVVELAVGAAVDGELPIGVRGNIRCRIFRFGGAWPAVHTPAH